MRLILLPVIVILLVSCTTHLISGEYVHTGSGDINITISQDEYRQDLEEKLSKNNRLLSEISELNARLDNLEESYKDAVVFFENAVKDLRTFKGDISEELLADAEAELQIGQTQKVSRIYDRLVVQKESDSKTAAKAAFERGKIEKENVDYRAALNYFALAVELEPSNPEYLRYAGSMAGTLGQYNKEFDWTNRSLDFYLKREGEASSNVAQLRNNMGEAWFNRRNYDKAIEYFKLALDSDLKAYGFDNPKVATRLSNLGTAWYQKGDYDRAVRYLQMSLESDRKTFGEDHPNIAIRYSNLGMVWLSKGDYDRAQVNIERALKSDLNNFGEYHPTVAIRRNNLGLVLYAKGEFEKALQQFEKSLTVLNGVMGGKHPMIGVVNESIRQSKLKLNL